MISSRLKDWLYNLTKTRNTTNLSNLKKQFTQTPNKFKHGFESIVRPKTQSKIFQEAKSYVSRRIPGTPEFKQSWGDIFSEAKEGYGRVKTAIKTDPLQFTPFGMRSQAVPAVKEFGKQLGIEPQRAEDIGYGLRGALSLTPFRKITDDFEPITQRQQTAQKIGQSAYGTALTAPLGGPNYLANILTRVGQGAALGMGMGAVSNIFQQKKVTDDLYQHSLQGIENSWQLSFTNLFADKIAAKFIPKLVSNKTGQAFKLLKDASKMDISGQVKRKLFINGAKTLFQRALLETPIETTFFTAINQLSDEKKDGFVQEWLKDLPGTLVGNLMFAGADVSLRGTYSFNAKQINQATQSILKTAQNIFSDQRGFARIPDIKLTPDKGLGLDLRRLGYTANEIKELTPPEAHKIIVEGKESTSWLEEPGWLRNKKQPPIQPDLAAKEMDKLVNDIPVEKKVSFLNYLSTPEKVFKKLDMETDFKQIRKGHEKYQTHLKQEVKRISDWIGRVPSKESNVKIFQWLDGKKEVQLNKTELEVAKEIKSYLKSWAVKLDLPEDKRISNYITHIFEKGVIEKEFDPDVAKKIAEEIPSSVFDPFLMKRGDVGGYVEDTWRALSAYVKRASRKFNMDPALEELKRSSDKLDLESWNYVKRFTDRVNLRPTEVDSLVDNFIKQTPVKYKLGQRPVALTSRQFRQMVYRATLGLNFRSSLTNLSQGANTYAILKEKYLAKGYLELFKRMKNKDMDELYQTHVLDDAFIQDRSLNVKKRMVDKLDKGLFAMFDMAEKINRGSAYFGAKQKALDEGKSTQEAVEFAKKVVRDTQFKFGAIDTPVALNSDVTKLLTQYSSYGIKQAEFLGEMIKNKDLAGMVRYSAATLLFAKTIGKLYGYKWTDAIPGFSASPFLQVAGEAKKLVSLDEDTRKEGMANLKRQLPGLTIPAGTQAKKAIQGYQLSTKGYAESKTGKVKYLAPETTTGKLLAFFFGPYSTKEAREYYDQDLRVLGDKQSRQLKLYQDLNPTQAKTFFKQIHEDRVLNKAVEDFKKKLEKGEAVPTDDLGLLQSVVGIDEVVSMPDKTLYQKSKKASAVFGKIDDIMDDEILSNQQKNLLIESMGISEQEANYYSVATDNTQAKVAWVLDELETMTPEDDFIAFLARNRVKINDKLIASDGVLNELYYMGYLTKAERTLLKNIDFTSQGTLRLKSTQATGKKKKKITLPKLPDLRTKAPQVKIPSLKMSKTQLTKVKPLHQASIAQLMNVPLQALPPETKAESSNLKSVVF